MALIVIVTSRFPFPGGEQFLETEIGYWETCDANVVILPAIAEGTARPIPGGLKVDLTLAQTRTQAMKVAYLALAPFSRLFLHEVRYLARARKVNLTSLYESLRTIAQTRVAARGLAKFARAHGGTIDLAYPYWNDTEAYGAALAKRRGFIRRVASRAHGFDVFEEVRRANHMPLKRQFIMDFDAIYPNSNFSHDYLTRVYGFREDRNVVSQLGVALPDRQSTKTAAGQCRIVSVSYCVPGKRIDKIVEALALAAQMRPDVAFEWTHVGGGPLLVGLEGLARARLSSIDNVRFVFRGALENREVLQFFGTEPIDLLLHASESEGLGVSLMEAMSAGIPVIAPAVGGIPQLVAEGRGILMSSAPEPAEIAGHLISFLEEAKNADVRGSARRFIEDNCSAAVLYPAFVKRCAHVAEM